MDELRKRFHGSELPRNRHGLFWGLLLAAIGGFWLLSSIGYSQEPARIVLPGLVIAWGLARLVSRD
jgi:hypothetical protein